MNPTETKNNSLTWVFGGMDKLDQHGMYTSPVFKSGTQSWNILVRSGIMNQERYVFIHLNHARYIVRQNWVCELSGQFSVSDVMNSGKLFTSTRQSTLITQSAHPYNLTVILRWSDVMKDFVRNNSLIVQVEFDYKIYDFSKNENIVTDSIVKVQSVDFHVSRGYLGSISKYFSDRFSNNNESDVTINEINPVFFAIVLASLYPNPIAVCLSNYEILIDWSTFFAITSLTKQCEDYFKKNQGAQLIQQILEIEKSDKKNKTIGKKKMKISEKRNYIFRKMNNLKKSKKRKPAGAVTTEKPNREKMMPSILVTLKRPSEFKLIMQTEEFKKLKDSTKVYFLNTALRFIG